MKKIFCKPLLTSLLVLGFVCIFTSCSPVLKVAVASNGSLTYSVESSVSPLIEETVRSFTGADESLPLFNGEQILAALQTAGLDSVGVQIPDTTSLVVSARTEAVASATAGTVAAPALTLPSLGGEAVCQDMVPQVSGAIGYCHSTQPGQRKLVLTISPHVLQQVMGIVPAETAEYLDLLSAPILTGEELSATEYTDLISVIYGGSVAKELANAKVRVLVTAPSAVQSATVSIPAGRARTKGQYVEFTLGLPDLLSHYGEIAFTVQY